MTALRACTLTGVDEHTDQTAIFKMAKEYPLAEFGVLYRTATMEKENGQGRYPRHAWIEAFVKKAEKLPDMRTALHICGEDAIDFLRQDEKLWKLASKFTRVQLNVAADGEKIRDLDAQKVSNTLHAFTYSYGYGRVILQYNEKNAAFCTALSRCSSSGKDFLLDASLGRGVAPEAWTSQRNHDFIGMRLGYAGGLGPHNLAKELPLIDEASDGRPFWIDAESKIRTPQDRLDQEKAQQYLKIASEYALRSDIRLAAEGVQHVPFATHVEKLKGIALDWWAGLAAGYMMVPPTKGASRAVYLSRRDGEFRGFQPSEYPNDLKSALEGLDVGCAKRSGQWMGITEEGVEVKGSSREDAMLRAAIAQMLGTDLPANPTMHPAYMERLAGKRVADEVRVAIDKEMFPIEADEPAKFAKHKP